MFIILAYDIEAKRVGKVMKTAKKYLTARQRSVFEGNLSESRLRSLKREIEHIIDTDKDSVVIYKYCYGTGLLIEEIGISNRSDDRFL